MEFKDLKLGTIIEQNDSYAVVFGIADFPDYEQYFIARDAYGYIPIILYKLVSLKELENALTIKKQFINDSLTVNMQEEIKSDLLYTAYLGQVTNFDMKPRTKEIKTWLLKNKMLYPKILNEILDIEDRKKRLKEIIVEREKYYKYLLNKLSCYANIVDDDSLEKNFDKLKFGEIYVSGDYFCICMDVQNNYFYDIKRKGTLKQNISSFVLTKKDILLYCSKKNPNLLYDTGANIRTYLWNKENYDKLNYFKE